MLQPVIQTFQGVPSTKLMMAINHASHADVIEDLIRSLGFGLAFAEVVKPLKHGIKSPLSFLLPFQTAQTHTHSNTEPRDGFLP
jgi:hypothetical protein